MKIYKLIHQCDVTIAKMYKNNLMDKNSYEECRKRLMAFSHTVDESVQDAQDNFVLKKKEQ